MTRRTYRTHKHCGGKVIDQSFCTKCRKWLVGDAIERKRKKPKE